MARYGVSHYGSSFYGAPLLSVFAADPFTAVAVGYGEIQLEWTSPGGAWDNLRLVRSYVGYPATQDNGTVVYTATLGADVHQFKDTGLLTDRWVYYAIYVHDPSQDLWIRSGSVRAYSPRSYAGGKRLYDLLPEIVKSEPLQRFMDVFGFSYDGLRNDANSLLDLYDADHVLYDLVPVLLEQFGVPRETELEPEQYRRFLRNAIHFYKTKGTSECAHGVTSAVTGWANTVDIGENLLWDADFSDFLGSLGYWGRTATDCTVVRIDASTDTDGSLLPPAMRMTCTVAGAISTTFVNGADIIDLHRLAIPVVHGAAYSLSMLVRASDIARSGAHLDVAWYDLMGNLLSISAGTPVPTRQGVDTVVQSPNVLAPANAFWAVPIITIDSATLGSYWDVRTVMLNRGSTVLPHEPGRNIRIYLDITDTDPLRIAVHKTRLIDILPRYLPFGATFSLIDGMPTSEVVVSDDTILVDYDPPPATAPVGRSLSVLFRDLVDNADVLSMSWAVRQVVGVSLTVEFNTFAHVDKDLTVEFNTNSNQYTATYTTPDGGP